MMISKVGASAAEALAESSSEVGDEVCAETSEWRKPKGTTRRHVKLAGAVEIRTVATQTMVKKITSSRLNRYYTT